MVALLSVVILLESASVSETVAFMVDRQVGSLFVVNGDCDLKGFLTTEDIVFSEHATSIDSMDETSVEQVMIPLDKLVYAKPNDNILNASEKMRQSNIRHLPILAAGNELPTNVRSIDHIVSVKGLISEIYNSLFSSQQSSQKPCNTKDEEAILIEQEKAISNAMQIPSLKSVLKSKDRMILNTDVRDCITVQRAIEEMIKHDCSYVVVRNQKLSADFEDTEEEIAKSIETELTGILTERDILKNVLAARLNVEETLVNNSLSQRSVIGHEQVYGKLCSVDSDSSLLTCMRIMAAHDHRHLPVVSKRKKKIVGIITSTDILEALHQTNFSEVVPKST